MTFLINSVAPQILPFWAPDDLQKGDRLSLTCSVQKGSRPLDLTWTKDDAELTSTSVLRIDEFTSMLTLASLSLSDIGRYSCHARNAAGEGRQTADVSVHGN